MKSRSRHEANVGLAVLGISCAIIVGLAAVSHCFALQIPVAAASTSAAQAKGNAHGAQASDASFVIGNADVLSINVWKEADLTRSIPVRSDGKISLPLVGDIQAAGRTPAQLAQDITEKLSGFITDPQVTVIVQQVNSEKYNVLGQVAKPGSYSLDASTTIVDAIATAGGFRDFAKKKSIYVLRESATGRESRVSFNYQDFIKGKHADRNIVLKPHDTVVVP